MTLLKDTGAFPIRPWGEAVTAWTKQAGAMDAAEIDAALSCAARRRCGPQGDPPLLPRAIAHHARARAVRRSRRGARPEHCVLHLSITMQHRLVSSAIVRVRRRRHARRLRWRTGRALAGTPAIPATDSVFRRARRLVSEGDGVTGRALVDSMLRAATEGTPALRRRAVLARRTRGDGSRRGAGLSARDRGVPALALCRRRTARARRAGTGARRSHGGVPASAAVRARASGGASACARRTRCGAAGIRAA